MLYLVATPIGNLQDMTYRAVETLRAVTLILAEDTRRFRILADHFDIRTPVRSFHEHNEERSVSSLLERLRAGESVAVVSDAGTPLISDPGFRLVRAARAEGFAVCPIPGACAVIAALTMSGFEIDRFRFDGFLPQKPAKRRKALLEAVESGMTCAFYESPYRILKALEDLVAVCPEAEVGVGRELTKMHEEFLSGSPAHVLGTLSGRSKVLGEFVLLIRRKGEPPVADETED